MGVEGSSSSFGLPPGNHAMVGRCRRMIGSERSGVAARASPKGSHAAPKRRLYGLVSGAAGAAHVSRITGFERSGQHAGFEPNLKKVSCVPVPLCAVVLQGTVTDSELKWPAGSLPSAE